MNGRLVIDVLNINDVLYIHVQMYCINFNMNFL